MARTKYRFRRVSGWEGRGRGEGWGQGLPGLGPGVGIRKGHRWNPSTSQKPMAAFFFNDTATTEIYTLSLHDALPISVPEPGAGEVLVRIAAAGVNYTDIGQRNGSNKIPLPAVLGSEGAGTVERVGHGATGFEPGD